MKLKLLALTFLLVSCSGSKSKEVEPTPVPSGEITSSIIPTSEPTEPSLPVSPTPTKEVYEETTIEYQRVERIINGYTVPAHLVEVKLKSLNDIRSCFATNDEGEYGVGITDSLQNVVNKTKNEIGQDILCAVNGDYTFSSETRRGYSVKDGIIYRTSVKSKNSVDLIFTNDNEVYLMKEGDFKLDGEVGQKSSKYWQIISFGPVLVEDSELVVDETTEIKGNTWVNNQRTCIGIIDWNHFYLLATEANGRKHDGPLDSFRLYDLGVMLLEYGCHTVYNLDGGYSSGIAVNNEVVFKPTRVISDIVYIVNG